MSELYTVQKMYEAFEGKSLQESEKGNPFVQINSESFSSSYVFKTELQRKQYLVSMTGQGLNEAIAWLEKGGKTVQDAQKMHDLLVRKQTDLERLQATTKEELKKLELSFPWSKPNDKAAAKAEAAAKAAKAEPAKDAAKPEPAAKDAAKAEPAKDAAKPEPAAKDAAKPEPAAKDAAKAEPAAKAEAAKAEPEKAADKPNEGSNADIINQATAFMNRRLNSPDFESEFVSTRNETKKLRKNPFSKIIFADLRDNAETSDLQMTINDGAILPHAYENVLSGDQLKAWRNLSQANKDEIINGLNQAWNKKAEEKLNQGAEAKKAAKPEPASPAKSADKIEVKKSSPAAKSAAKPAAAEKKSEATTKPEPKPADKLNEDPNENIIKEAIESMNKILQDDEVFLRKFTEGNRYSIEKKLIIQNPFSRVSVGLGSQRNDLQMKNNGILFNTHSENILTKNIDAWRNLSQEEKDAIIKKLNDEWNKKAEEKLKQLAAAKPAAAE